MIVVAALLDFGDVSARDTAVKRSASVQWATRQEEAGCLAYCFAADPSIETRIQVYELWEDGPSLAAHFKHANYAAMRVVLRDGLVGSWNQMYRVEEHEPVYAPDGSAREEFFTSVSGPASPSQPS